MIDLHTHSKASDGQYTPSELVQLAHAAGIKTLALTDHDTTAGLAEAAAEAHRLGLQFVPAIEMDAKYPGIEGRFHILGYGIDPCHLALADCCRNYAQQRQERAERIFAYLAQLGMPLDRKRVMEKTDGAIGRPHFARAMVEVGYVSDTREAFDRYLDTEEFQKIDRPKPHPRMVIAQIKAAGGVAVLAHPNQLKLGDRSLKDLLVELMGYGLQGLECWYSTYTTEETAQYLALAEGLGLCTTGGSDFHGPAVKPHVTLGVEPNGAVTIFKWIEQDV